MSHHDPTRGETPTDPLAGALLAVIEAQPHHRRLYPDLYIAEVAAAARRHLEQASTHHPADTAPETHHA